MIFSLFGRGRLFEGAFILKTEILGGRSFEGGVYSRRGVYSRKYGMLLRLLIIIGFWNRPPLVVICRQMFIRCNFCDNCAAKFLLLGL